MQAFGPARRDGLGATTVEGVVYDQIGNTRRSSKMPPDLVTGQDARDVAAYVAAVAGRPGKDVGALAAAGQPKVSNKPIAAKGGVLTMDADPTGALAFASTKASAMAGALEFVMGNESSVQHNIALEGGAGGPRGGSGRHVEVQHRREGRRVRLPLHRPRPRRGRHERDAHRQISSAAATMPATVRTWFQAVHWLR